MSHLSRDYRPCRHQKASLPHIGNELLIELSFDAELSRESLHSAAASAAPRFRTTVSSIKEMDA